MGHLRHRLPVEVLTVDMVLDELENVRVSKHLIGLAIVHDRKRLVVLIDPSFRKVAGVTGVIPTPEEHRVSARRARIDDHIAFIFHQHFSLQVTARTRSGPATFLCRVLLLDKNAFSLLANRRHEIPEA